MDYRRAQFSVLKDRLSRERQFIQVVMGPRQVGKTTTVKQVVEELGEGSCVFFSADNVPATQSSWISDCWDVARLRLRGGSRSSMILIIDEIQKIDRWSEVVKKEWDKDSFENVAIKVVLLGSSRVMLQKGLADSLAGRFETIKFTHWSYPEMRDAFGVSLEEYIYFGGYPGAARLIADESRWREYIKDSIIETSINKDILIDTPIGKPALLRQTFELGAAYSGEILSLTKMIGQLQDAGNTTTLSGYLNLLHDCGLIGALQKFSVDMARRRASIPKFQVFNNALRNVYEDSSFVNVINVPRVWGRVVESAVGAYLLGNSFVYDYQLYYWRDNNDEVDFIVKKGNNLIAIEVKSGNDMRNSGMKRFKEMFNPRYSFIVGKDGMSLEDFFMMPVEVLFG